MVDTYVRHARGCNCVRIESIRWTGFTGRNGNQSTDNHDTGKWQFAGNAGEFVDADL